MARIDIILAKAERIRELKHSLKQITLAKQSGRGALGLIPDFNNKLFENQEIWTPDNIPQIQALVLAREAELLAELQAIEDTPLGTTTTPI